MFNIAREYNKNIFDAMKEETETECLCSQVSAIREIVLECGPANYAVSNILISRAEK